eukprot:gene1140-1372_t
MWAGGSQHRLNLPSLAPLHRWDPCVARAVHDRALEAGLLSAVVAAPPWRGQGFVDLPLDGRPRVYFDGGRARAYIELAAGVLALRLAVDLVLIGDSASALGALRRTSTGAWAPGRAELLQRAAVAVLRSGLTASSLSSPADPPSCARGFERVLCANHRALVTARGVAVSCFDLPEG